MPRKKNARALTQRQKKRIAAIRDDRVARWEQNRKKELAHLEGDALGAEEAGAVAAHFGSHVEVEDATGALHRCAVRETLAENPVCGDQVIWRRGANGQGVITGLRPRRSLLRRPAAYDRLQTVAANIDRIIVTAAATYPNPGLLDRYLAAASAAEVEAVIVINKCDLLDDIGPVEAILAPYRAMDYAVLMVSVNSGAGLGALAEMLTGGMSVFVGQSGVGKSSLINHWVPEQEIRIGAVNPETGKGRHTTSVARLHRLSCGGRLIDSPGVREFGLHAVAAADVARHFREIAPFLGRCRFSDCGHRQEPGCAVREAVAAGAVHPRRLESLHRIVDSMASKRPF